MKKKKLIDALLELNIKPEDWPEEYQFAALDSDGEVYIYKELPSANWVGGSYKLIAKCEPRKMNKFIVRRSDFVERYLKNLTVIKATNISQEQAEELKRHFNDQTYLKALCPTPHKEEIEDLKERLKIQADCATELAERIDHALIHIKICDRSDRRSPLLLLIEILEGKDGE